jgi:hypothetical protein
MAFDLPPTDTRLIMEALFDIRAMTARVLRILEEDDEEEGEEDG